MTDGERVYVLFGNVGAFAFTLEGKEVWSKRFEPRNTRYGWGTAASPVLHEGRLFIVNDNDDRAELFALEAKTGKELWRVDRDEKSNWATPFIWDNGQRTELITASFSHDGHGKTDRLDRFMGVESGQFFLSSGGFIPGFTTYGEKFTRPATEKCPTDLERSKLPAK